MYWYFGSTAVYCGHTYIYSLLTSTVATWYCHNHIHIAVADIIYMYIYMSFSQTVFVWQTLYHLCAPLLLCTCSIGCYAARQYQHTRVHGVRSTRGYTRAQAQ